MKAYDARARAARVLERVWVDGAFSAAALDTELTRDPPLDARDAALATELVYGVLRTQGFLEATVMELSSRGRPFDEPVAKAHLLIGLYSIAFLEKVPAFAAVNEAVDAVRERIGERPAGFVNHVLRSTARRFESGKRPSVEDALVEGAPGWLRGALRRSLGRKGARDFLASAGAPAPLGIAVGRRDERSSWLEKIEAVTGAGRFREGSWSPHALVGERAGDPRRLPGHEVDWIVQEEGAQVVALSLGAQAGDRVLDACAGRGNKTWLLSKLCDDVVAADRHPSKLERLASRTGVETHAIDWSVGTGGLAATFDRVLVDAPCSGVGTLRRRPEIALHKDIASVQALADEQTAITRNAAALVRDGGRLVYAVCSVLGEECEQVVERLLAANSSGAVELEPVAFDAGTGVPAAEPGASTVRLLPHIHGTDGYFIASFSVRHRKASCS